MDSGAERSDLQQQTILAVARAKLGITWGVFQSFQVGKSIDFDRSRSMAAFNVNPPVQFRHAVLKLRATEG